MRLSFFALLVVACLGSDAQAQCGGNARGRLFPRLFGRHRVAQSSYGYYQATYASRYSVQSPAPGACGAAQSPAPGVAYQVTATATVTTVGDAGFLGWLNAERTRRGLRALAWDAALAGDCSANNAAQSARGLGHHWLGRARRQNAAMAASLDQAWANWMASPAHNAALFAPDITHGAVVQSGSWFTFAAY